MKPPVIEISLKDDYFCPTCLSTGDRLPGGKILDIVDDENVLSYLKDPNSFICPPDDNLARIKKRSSNYAFQDEQLYKLPAGEFQARIVPSKRHRASLIRGAHEDAGHFGIKRVEAMLIQKYTWSGMRQDIQTHCSNCSVCQVHHAKFSADPVLHSIPVEPSAWHTIGIDFMGPLPLTVAKNRYLIIAIDYFTKWVEVLPLPDHTANSAALFLQKLLNRFGRMSTVSTDQGRHFQGEFQDLLSKHHIDQRLSRAYHPQTNGLVERAVRTIGEALKRSTAGDREKEARWDELLPSIVQGYNFSKQASTRQSPFYLHHGWHPTLPVNVPNLQWLQEPQTSPEDDPRAPSDLPRAPAHPISSSFPSHPDPADPSSGDPENPEIGHLAMTEIRTRQIKEATQKRHEAARNIQVAQGRQAVAYNRRRNIRNPTECFPPHELFTPGDFVITRDYNKNFSLKPGELAGSKKLRGAAKGPFKYVGRKANRDGNLSERYGTVEDNLGRTWEKAFHDMIPYDRARRPEAYGIKDFPVSTQEAIRIKSTWSHQILAPSSSSPSSFPLENPLALEHRKNLSHADISEHHPETFREDQPRKRKRSSRYEDEEYLPE